MLLLVVCNKYLNIKGWIHFDFATKRVNMGEMKDWVDYLDTLYYDIEHESGLSSVEKLYQRVKAEGVYELSRKQIVQYLQKQDTYTLHKPIKRTFPRNRVLAIAIDEIWQLDLCDVQALSRYNKGYKYILTCIDVFSKFAWARPLKNKRGKTILNAFRSIVNSGQKRAPMRVQTDEGKEFLNSHVQDS